MKDSEFKILVVDDSLSIREMMNKFLSETTEYQIFEESDGLNALEFIEKNDVHLIITDIVMPNIDGLTLLKKMKYFKPEVPIIVISGYQSDDNVEMAHKYYAERFFSKPFDWSQLLNAIKKAKTAYQESMMSKQVPQYMNLHSKIKINFDNSKMNRFINEKIIKLLTSLYLISYDAGTQFYMIISELLMIGKKLSKTISEDNQIYFYFDQNNFQLEFTIDDEKETINLRKILETEEASALENFRKYADEVIYPNDRQVIIRKKIQ